MFGQCDQADRSVSKDEQLPSTTNEKEIGVEPIDGKGIRVSEEEKPQIKVYASTKSN